MSTPKKSTITANKVALYDKLIATNPKIERKGAANPYTSLNGHMFTLLHQSAEAQRRENQEQEFMFSCLFALIRG
jgi:hypothetical protein